MYCFGRQLWGLCEVLEERWARSETFGNFQERRPLWLFLWFRLGKLGCCAWKLLDALWVILLRWGLWCQDWVFLEILLLCSELVLRLRCWRRAELDLRLSVIFKRGDLCGSLWLRLSKLRFCAWKLLDALWVILLRWGLWCQDWVCLEILFLCSVLVLRVNIEWC